MGSTEAITQHLAYVTPGVEHAGSENVHVVPSFLAREQCISLMGNIRKHGGIFETPPGVRVE